MKFHRSDEYEQKLFELALFDEKKIYRDGDIMIVDWEGSKLKAYCEQSDTYLQFPRNLRDYHGQEYVADIVEVQRDDNVRKYYRVVKGSIRAKGSDEVLG